MKFRQNHWRIACSVALLLLGFSAPSRALDPDRPLSQALLRIWQSQQGLPRAAILSIRQTSDGYLWLGTQAGLYRFDGVRFVAMQETSPRKPNNLWVQDLAEDGERQLWIGGDSAGLLRLTRGSGSKIGSVDGLGAAHVRCVLVNHSGELCVGTDDGFGRFRDGKFVVSRVADGLPDNRILALSEAVDGTLWIATAGPHLCRWDGVSFQSFDLQSLPPRATINALLCGPDNVLWIGATAGLIRRIGTEERCFTTEDGLGNELVHCLARSSTGGIWAGTKDGLCRVQGDQIERFQTRDGLSQSTVYALCEDHEGSLWVGTKHGLNQLVDRRTLLPFTTSEGLPSNDTGSILQDRQGRTWVGTLDAGLAEYDGREFLSVATAENAFREVRSASETVPTDSLALRASVRNMPSNAVLSLADGAADGLWVGTDQGLCRLSEGKIVDRYTTAEGLPSNVIRCLCRDQLGVLWVGTAAGLVELRDGQFVRPDGDADALHEPVQVLIDFRGEYLIASTSRGRVYRVSQGRLGPLTDALPLDCQVDAFYLDPQERLWMAIRGSGLGLFDGKNLVRLGVKDGLYDDDICGVAGDDKGQLWMACSRGIFAVALAELNDFAVGKISQVTSTPFSPTDALRTIECRRGVQPAIWKMQDGRVWFSTMRGIIVVDPERATRPLPRPAVLVEEIRVNGQEMSPQHLERLPPGSNNFEFHYTALSFASPGRITFQYKLEQFDGLWIDAGKRREAFYTNLKPGSYRFRVRALNSDGAWHEVDRPIDFSLQPHFYQRAWFVPALIAGFVGVGGLAYRFRIRQVKARLKAVLSERSRIARELHDTLIQGFSGVTMQMQALASRLQDSGEMETLSEIIRDAGGCLREARRSVAGLRNSQVSETGLAASIAQAARQLTETSDIRLRLQLGTITPVLEPDIEYNLLRIVQEAIANAIKHADATAIDVSLDSDGRWLNILVRDDGIGFDVNRYLEPARPGHYGLVGMRERAVQIGAEVSWCSAPGQGTTVAIRRPFATTGSGDRSPQFESVSGPARGEPTSP